MNFDAKKNWRISVLAIVIVFSLILLGTKGLSFGIDFTGGTELKLELEEGGDEYASAVVDILKNRLNGLGLKSTQVLKEADGRHITIKVSTTDEGELADVKDIIDQQAVFEQMVEGNLCAAGDEIQLDLTRQGGAFVSGTSWQVYVRNTGAAPARCGEVMAGKAGHMTDIFLDRPRDSFILLDSDSCNEISTEQFINHADDVGYTILSFLEARSQIPVICYTTAEEEQEEGLNESLLEDLGIEAENTTEAETFEDLELNETIERIRSFAQEGKDRVIISIQREDLPGELSQIINESGLDLRISEKSPEEAWHAEDEEDSWVARTTGLKSTLRIGEGLTNGNPVYSSVFQGASNSLEGARTTAEQFKIWLTSGNLPVEAEIILERPNLPELGSQFLRYAMFIAIFALLLVASIISIRYRELKISAAILTTSFSEIVMILGFASLFSWELDLAAMAGIIAAIGTGVDHQIVITDETLRGERKKSESKLWDVRQSINRAFFIILTSAVTTISAMLPLMSIIDLRGFAFTSIMGILIGILISRPAYGRIVEIIT